MKSKKSSGTLRGTSKQYQPSCILHIMYSRIWPGLVSMLDFGGVVIYKSKLYSLILTAS